LTEIPTYLCSTDMSPARPMFQSHMLVHPNMLFKAITGIDCSQRSAFKYNFQYNDLKNDPQIPNTTYKDL